MTPEFPKRNFKTELLLINTKRNFKTAVNPLGPSVAIWQQ